MVECMVGSSRCGMEDVEVAERKRGRKKGRAGDGRDPCDQFASSAVHCIPNTSSSFLFPELLAFFRSHCIQRRESFYILLCILVSSFESNSSLFLHHSGRTCPLSAHDTTSVRRRCPVRSSRICPRQAVSCPRAQVDARVQAK